MNRTRWLTTVALALALLTALLVGRQLLWRDASPDDHGDRHPALVELAELREAVATCQAEVEAEQARFLAHEARVDSLHAVVRAHESAERTVPVDEFEAYMEAFDAYNQSVDEWHERAATLQTASDACRVLADRHNELVESLSPGTGGRPTSTSTSKSGIS